VTEFVTGGQSEDSVTTVSRRMPPERQEAERVSRVQTPSHSVRVTVQPPRMRTTVFVTPAATETFVTAEADQQGSAGSRQYSVTPPSRPVAAVRRQPQEPP